MILQAFISKHKGNYLDWDGSFGAQCVDLARFYFSEVCGLKKQPAGVVGAKDFYLNFEKDPVLTEYFEKIPNTPKFVPLPGDVAIWDKTPGNSYGHIAIVVTGNVQSFSSFDQHLPKSAPCRIVHHTYKNVLGFLRPKEKGA
jgi:hypothetical protein